MLRTKQQQQQQSPHRRRHKHHRSSKMNEQQGCKQPLANGANGSHKPLCRLQCVDKMHQIPVLESAFGVVGSFYDRLKKCNSMADWSLGLAQDKLSSVVFFTLNSPTLQMPILLADSAVCYSLGFVEDRLPAIKQPPQELFGNVKGMVSEKAGALARPVLVRATSVKELAARRMSSACDYSLQRADQAMNTRVGAIAAESIDVGLELAEQLLDTYLPAESSDEAINTEKDEPDSRDFRANGGGEHHRALLTVHRVDRLTRTLQRRLTRRTLAQVKSLREHALDAMSFILGLAKTAVRDPKGSADYLTELWRELSEEEPENQPPPETLEQRSVLLARETARRLVHVVNAVSNLPMAASTKFTQLLIEVLHSLHLEGATHVVVVQTRRRYEQLQAFVAQINSIASQILEAGANARRPAPQPNNSSCCVDQTKKVHAQ